MACEKNDVDLCDANIRLTVTFDEKYSDSNFFGNPRPLSSSGKA
ncbi:putative exported domain protein [Yersinia pestis PY-66]|nr:putative exported domain protein [Yersinia pestis PY-66]